MPEPKIVHYRIDQTRRDEKAAPLDVLGYALALPEPWSWLRVCWRPGHACVDEWLTGKAIPLPDGLLWLPIEPEDIIPIVVAVLKGRSPESVEAVRTRLAELEVA